MATIRYVRHDADGSGDGTTTANSGANGAWTLAQAIAATPAADTEIRIMATGTYSRTETWTCAYANGTAAANIVITGANSSGVVDGTKATIQAGAGSITLMQVTGQHIAVKNLTFDGNSQSSVVGLYFSVAAYSRAVRCKAMNCTSYGIRLATSNGGFIARCEATGCSGTAAIALDDRGRAIFCEAHSNTTHGFRMDVSTQALYCVSYGNSGASTDGFNCSSVGYFADHCVAYGNGRAGFDLTGNAGYGSHLSNCISYGNTGDAYRTDGVKSGVYLLNCAGPAAAASGSPIGYDTDNLANVEGYVTLAADPFTNAAAGDFSLNTTAGGAACRAAGFPGAMPRGTTTGYTDVGVAQHADPVGGGGGGVNIIGGLVIA